MWKNINIYKLILCSFQISGPSWGSLMVSLDWNRKPGFPSNSPRVPSKSHGRCRCGVTWCKVEWIETSGLFYNDFKLGDQIEMMQSTGCKMRFPEKYTDRRVRWGWSHVLLCVRDGRGGESERELPTDSQCIHSETVCHRHLLEIWRAPSAMERSPISFSLILIILPLLLPDAVLCKTLKRDGKASILFSSVAICPVSIVHSEDLSFSIMLCTV